MIVFSNKISIDNNDFFRNGGKRLSFRDYSHIYQKIKTWIDLKDDRSVRVFTYNDTYKLKENIVKRLSCLLDKKESPPENITDKELKKWLKKNPREIVEILGKKISIGGLGLMPPPLDREIITYNKLLTIVDSCIDTNSPLYIKIEEDNYN